MDWDNRGRGETVEIRDAVSGALLDSRALSAFAGGQYWRWTLSGHVTIRVTNTGTPNAVVSGLFFDRVGEFGAGGSADESGRRRDVYGAGDHHGDGDGHGYRWHRPRRVLSGVVAGAAGR